MFVLFAFRGKKAKLLYNSLIISTYKIEEKGYDLVTTQIPQTSLICCRFKQLLY